MIRVAPRTLQRRGLEILLAQVHLQIYGRFPPSVILGSFDQIQKIPLVPIRILDYLHGMGHQANSGKHTILIVEDEPAIADNIAFAVETEHMIPVRAATAGEGRQLLQKHEISLIVLDVGLPDESGFDFCRTLRQHSEVPIIFLTARSDEVDRIVGLELGADDYVSKPFSPRELTARIRAILRRCGSPAPSSEVAEPLFRVDQDTKTIFFRGRALDLSRYEYRMLELMIDHPGQVFSRDQLMEHAWEEPDASYDRTVDTHIKTLRSKLRQIEEEADYLMTRRGWGYFLKVDP